MFANGKSVGQQALRTVASRALSTNSASALSLRQRPRRNRKSAGIRASIRETWLAPQHFVLPLFVHDLKTGPCLFNHTQRECYDSLTFFTVRPVKSLPGCSVMGLDALKREVCQNEKAFLPIAYSLG